MAIERNITRRVFTGGMALASMRVLGANDRIRIGVIGTGVRGAGRHLPALAARQDVEVVAACDIYQGRLDSACQKAGVKPVKTQDFRRVLDRNDIDAVVIAVADHWHTPVLLEALAAGKDAYLEKPMTFRMEEGRQIVEAVRKTRRVVQIGTQQKSGPHFIEAKERFIDSGRIGKVALVRTWWIANGGYSPSNLLRYPPKDFVYDPKQLDWNRFLGTAPTRPFDAGRYFGWYRYKDYSTGQLGGLLVHTIDVPHFFLGLTRPNAVVASGGIYRFPDDRDTPDTISVLAEYPQKVTVTFDATEASPATRSVEDLVDVEFHGSGGVLKIFRTRYIFESAEKGAPPIVVQGQDCDGPHMQRFLDAVRDRKQPNADVVYSHYLAAVCHMGNMAYETGNRVAWNSAWDVPALE